MTIVMQNPEADTAKSPTKTKRPSTKEETKTELILRLLRRKAGASLPELQERTGWQAHSVRGFLSGTVKRKLGLTVETVPDAKGVRRYRIAAGGSAA